jgi:hypothetical protein
MVRYPKGADVPQFLVFLQLIFSIITFALVAEYSGYSKVDFTVSSK